MASHSPSTHKGHGFKYVQTLGAGAAICTEFKVSIDLS